MKQQALAAATTKDNPGRGVKLLLVEVKEATKDITQIQKTKAFYSFFRASQRRWGEAVEGFHERFNEKYDILAIAGSKGLPESAPPTSLSQDLKAFFFLDSMNLHEHEVKEILKATHNKSDEELTLAEMRPTYWNTHIQEQQGERKPQQEHLSYGVTSSSSRDNPRQQFQPVRLNLRRTYLADGDGNEPEPGDGDSDGGSSDHGDGDGGNDGPDGDGPTPVFTVEEVGQALIEFEAYLAAADISDLSQKEADKAATVAQDCRMSYGQARKTVAASKVDRDFTGKFSANGQVSSDTKGLQDRLQALKERKKCKDCNQYGHWAGDKQCPKVQGSKPKGQKGTHKPGGGNDKGSSYSGKKKFSGPPNRKGFFSSMGIGTLLATLVGASTHVLDVSNQVQSCWNQN